MRRGLIGVAGLVALVAIFVGVVNSASSAFGQTTLLATTPVPSPEDFSVKVTGCRNSVVSFNLHDAYPGPLTIVVTRTTQPPGQPVTITLKPGDNALTGPSSARSMTFTVQVQGGEGAVAVLTVNRSAWAQACGIPAAPVTGHGWAPPSDA
jgi:hypothetical protein